MLGRKLTIFGAVRNCAPYFLLIALSCIWVLPASAAPKTDTVIFKNGDKLTGEVKSLKRGRLSLNTDATGTISIEWDKIAGVISDQHIQVETTSGIRYFGSLTSSQDNPSLIIVTENHRRRWHSRVGCRYISRLQLCKSWRNRIRQFRYKHGLSKLNPNRVPEIQHNPVRQ